MNAKETNNNDYSKRVIRYYIYRSNNTNSNSQKETEKHTNIQLNKIFL